MRTEISIPERLDVTCKVSYSNNKTKLNFSLVLIHDVRSSKILSNQENSELNSLSVLFK